MSKCWCYRVWRFGYKAPWKRAQKGEEQHVSLPKSEGHEANFAALRLSQTAALLLTRPLGGAVTFGQHPRALREEGRSLFPGRVLKRITSCDLAASLPLKIGVWAVGPHAVSTCGLRSVISVRALFTPATAWCLSATIARWDAQDERPLCDAPASVRRGGLGAGSSCSRSVWFGLSALPSQEGDFTRSSGLVLDLRAFLPVGVRTEPFQQPSFGQGWRRRGSPVIWAGAEWSPGVCLGCLVSLVREWSSWIQPTLLNVCPVKPHYEGLCPQTRIKLENVRDVSKLIGLFVPCSLVVVLYCEGAGDLGRVVCEEAQKGDVIYPGSRMLA